ncbi:MAG: GNAT family N-acetyltransferase [Betaproteobacteria bacterium]
MEPAPRSDVAFRHIVDADTPFLRRLYGITREQELRIVPWSEEQKAAFLDMQFAAQKSHYENHYPDCDFLIVELEGKAAGRIYIDRQVSEIRLIDIILLPEYRGRGIGRLLVEEILEEARGTDRKVTIYVEHFNPARGLYDRLGFRHTETNGVYHRMEWRP